MKIIYVAGPFRSTSTPYSQWEQEGHIRRAEDAAMQIARLGAVPLVPHSMFRFFQGELPDRFWLEGTLELLRRADAILLCQGWRESTGSRGEAEEAERLGLPVFANFLEIARWLRDTKD